MVKPVSFIDWTDGNPDQATISVEPSAAKKEAGWLQDERPPRQTMNWVFQNVDEWIKYLDSQVDAFANQGIIYDAFVGAGGTHADINALMADGDIANIKNVLVVSALAVDTTQEIDQDGMNFYFKAGAGITKNGPTGADIGLQINADRVRIKDARFIGFNDVGVDEALKILATKKNNLIHGCMFSDCDTQINDLGTNNVLNANIEEV